MEKLITVNELRLLMPQLSLVKAGAYTPHLAAAMAEFDITSKRRRCAFLAQLAHESAQLRYMEEIDSGIAYEGRQDLGNLRRGDGMRFKGRGPIQLTGRANYRAFGHALGLDLLTQPELAAKPEHGFRIAGLFWQLHGCNELADLLTFGTSIEDQKRDRITFGRITRRINGGLNGIDDRLNYFRVARQVLHNDDAPATHETAAPSASPALVSGDPAEPDVDLLGVAVTKRLWPRLVRHFVFALGWAEGMYQAHKFGSIVVIALVAAVIGWVLYHNRKRIFTNRKG